MNSEEIAKVATLNDVHRRDTRFRITKGVKEITDIYGLVQAIRDFSDFNEDNDPHGEHDFGKLEWHGETIFWKIDYYDRTHREWRSPLSPSCYRVLTVMLAEEY